MSYTLSDKQRKAGYVLHGADAPYRWRGTGGSALKGAIYRLTILGHKQSVRLEVWQHYPRQTAGNKPVYDNQADFDKDWEAV